MAKKKPSVAIFKHYKLAESFGNLFGDFSSLLEAARTALLVPAFR
ncbi:hypothetical protein [Snodgrassella gandavensis]|nr:hypothetical protein [Snodgrassella gandavensis]